MYNTLIVNKISAVIGTITAAYPQNRIFILVDNHTAKFCLPAIQQSLHIPENHVITIESGDEHKNIETLVQVWSCLSQAGATRHSLLINVGGGMVTDLGGFAASTFKRGIAYLNISTTLLGAVDAATGGKTGINFNGLKNEIGVFRPADKVLVATEFFSTLDARNIRSGFAEMLKHALISSDADLQQILAFDLDEMDWDKLTDLLRRNIDIKQQIVEQDPTEKGLRKALNFGHTVGHALESLSYATPTPALHGYAVMWGMVAELYLSFLKLGFPKEKLLQVVQVMREYYGKAECPCGQYEKLFELMKHDKKNEDSDAVNFTLLADVGDVHVNQTATKAEMFEALDFLANL